MGGSISSENAFSGNVGFKSCLYTISSEELCTRNEQNSYDNMKKILKEILPIENPEYSTSYSEEEKEADDNDLLPDKKFHSLIEGLKILERSPVLEKRDECNMMKIQLHSFDVDASNDLNKHVSELLHLHLPSDEEGEIIEEENTYLKEENLSSVPTLLTPSKLLSAIKGSRSQNGNLKNAKLSVKWAPDVYDPPVTSSSHTVKGRNRHHHHHSHNHHPKSKKDYYTSKHSKGKSSKGGVSDRKLAHRKSRHSTSTDPQTSRFQALGSRKPIDNTCIDPKIGPIDAEVHSKESIKKYGSSCYMEPLASLPLAVAEVS